jgi:protein-S-isoprenylcysteine O-methyltransferase Ste14
VIAAVFIFVVGIFISNLLKNMVSAAANNAGLSEGRLLSRIVEITVMIFVIALAMDHLNIGARIVELTVGIILASLGLGLAIAIGLGCKDIIGRIAGDFIEKLWARK